MRVCIRRVLCHISPPVIVSLPHFRHGGHCPVR